MPRYHQLRFAFSILILSFFVHALIERVNRIVLFFSTGLKSAAADLARLVDKRESEREREKERERERERERKRERERQTNVTLAARFPRGPDHSSTRLKTVQGYKYAASTKTREEGTTMSPKIFSDSQPTQ
uniref:Uncharacterized protein n=1 Tax=Vespula pensylvanica TaxID=30213 RepID=A0A834P566_VESPE|nr:hypothetical protein H0235_005585 [Vespula pensylvanica]